MELRYEDNWADIMHGSIPNLLSDHHKIDI